MLRQLKMWMNSGLTDMKLLYRAPRDGFTPTSLHERCDHAKSSINLIKVRKPSDPVAV